MNVLIVRPDGIGDVLFSLPVATQLKQLMPGVTVGFLVSPIVGPLLEHHTDVDYVRTICLTDSMKELRHAFSNGVDAVVFLKPFRRLMWAAWGVGVPIRVATGYRWYSLLVNRRVYEHRSEFAKHESEYNVEMLTALGVEPKPVRPPALVLSDVERSEGAGRWAQVPSPRVVIHPGGMSARHWRPEQYRDLAVQLARAGYGVVLTGSEAERVQLNPVFPSGNVMPSSVINMMGHLSIRELMAVIANAHVVVSGATGPAHIAAALGVATVSLFDPRRNNSPVRWKPLSRGVLLRPDVPTCDKCIGTVCPFWDCMDQFTVATVATAVRDVVQSPSPLTVLHV